MGQRTATGRSAKASVPRQATGRPVFIDHADQPPACRSHDPVIWFPDKEGPRETRKAKAICDSCPHLNPCREWAYEQPSTSLYGIWGGTTYSERRNRAKRHRR